MVGAKLCRPAEGTEVLGVLLMAGGGGGDLLLPGSSGSHQWTSGTSVSVQEGLGWSVEAWNGSWMLCGFSGRKEANCL